MLVEQFLYMFTSDVSELEKGEKKAQKENDKLQKGLVKTDKVANDLGNSFTDIIATAGGALTALLSFGALSAGIAETSAYVDGLAKVSDRMGENINDMAAWQESVKKSGGDIGAFQGTLKGFTSQLQDLSVKGQNEMLPFLQKLGISFKDNNGNIKSALTLFPEIAESFEKLSKTESAGIGQKLGLDEGTVLLLQQGRKAVEDQIKAQKGLFNITREQAKIFENFNDSIDDTKTAFRGMYVQLGADVLPILQYFMEKLQGGISFMAEHKDFVTGAFIGLGAAISAYAIPAIIKFGIATFTAFAPFYVIGGIIAGVALAVGLLYDEISTFISGGNSAFEDMLKWLGMTDTEIENLRQTFIGLGDSISTIFKFIGEVLKGLFGIGKTVAKGIYKAFEPLLWLFSKGIIGAIELAIKGIQKIADIAESVMSLFGIGETKAKLKLSTELSEEQRQQFNGNLLKTKEEQDYSSILTSSKENPLNTITPNMMNNTNSNKTTNTSVNISKVEVNTQATDAEGISMAIDKTLAGQLKKTTSTFEDGIEG